MLAKRVWARNVGDDANAVVGTYRSIQPEQVFRQWDTGDIDASEWRKNPS